MTFPFCQFSSKFYAELFDILFSHYENVLIVFLSRSFLVDVLLDPSPDSSPQGNLVGRF